MTRFPALTGWLTLLLVLPGTAASGQATNQEFQDEIEALKQGQEQIQKDLQEIKKLLQARAQPQRPAAPDVAGKVFDLGDNPVKGESTAKITLVEFTDYQ